MRKSCSEILEHELKRILYPIEKEKFQNLYIYTNDPINVMRRITNWQKDKSNSILTKIPITTKKKNKVVMMLFGLFTYNRGFEGNETDINCKFSFICFFAM